MRFIGTCSLSKYTLSSRKSVGQGLTLQLADRSRGRRPLSDPLPFTLPGRVIGRWSPCPAAPALELLGPRTAGVISIQ